MKTTALNLLMLSSAILGYADSVPQWTYTVESIAALGKNCMTLSGDKSNTKTEDGIAKETQVGL